MTQPTTYLHVTPTDYTGRHRAPEPTLPSRAVPEHLRTLRDWERAGCPTRQEAGR